MKHITLFALTTCVLTCIIYFSCQKSISYEPGIPQVENVQAAVSGRITSNSNQPVEGAVVTAGTATAVTDINGQFSISNATLNKHAGFVKVEKEGFFMGSRTFSVSEDNNNYVSIRLIKKTVAGSFSAASGGSVNVPAGGSISFPAGSIMNAATKAAYTGTVSVDAFFINPAAADFSDIMPGALLGVNAGNREVGLQSYGMMAVELTGSNGEKLQLMTGKKADLSFPIPQSLQANAPASIPLWFFDETTGLWKEEGTATRQGNNYTGQVTHFSFWNCDDPFPITDFSATIQYQNGDPLIVSLVELRVKTDTAISAVGYTDNNGYVSGKIPVGKPLEMRVYNTCGSLVHSGDIGTFNSATNLGVIIVNSAGILQLTLTGAVVDCNGSPVSKGSVLILLDGIYRHTGISNGNFSIPISRCNGNQQTATLTVTDSVNNQQSSPIPVTISGSNVNAGQLSACGISTTRFMNYTVGNDAFSVPAFMLSGYRYNNTTYYFSDSIANGLNFRFSGPATPGVYAIETLSANVNNTIYVRDGPMNITVTEYGTSGEFIAGSFSGNLKDTMNSASILPVTCDFRILRAQ